MARSVKPAESAERGARQRIVAAARRHFLAHGFRRVTMGELAEGLGMSKKTLYVHFPSKESLLEAVLLDKFRSLEADVDQVTSRRATDSLNGLHDLLACVQRHTEEIQPPFVRDLQREAPDLFQLVERRRRQVIETHFGKLLTRGRREGFIRKDIPVRLIIEILLGAAQAIMNPPRMAELGLTPRSGFTAIISVILEGAISHQGRAKRWPSSRQRTGRR